MVLKKPYAFLIKHFRLIHLILAIPLIFITYKTHLVVGFFNDYVSNGYTFQTGTDVSSVYINWIMLLSIFLIVLSILAIYYLLKHKEKPVRMYVIMIIFYLLTFIMLCWYSGILAKMSTSVLAAKTARFYRDLSLLIYFPQYIFDIFVIIRAIGFNLKQMDFQSDFKELQITELDSEEVEVGLELENYKAKRFFRRFKREFSYYIAENKFMVTIVSILLLFSLIALFYFNQETYDTVYSNNETFYHKGFNISLKDSIITNISYDGTKLKNSKYYLVLKFGIENTSIKNQKLDYDNFAVYCSDKKILPVLDQSEYFIDYAMPYYGKEIKAKTNNDYVLLYSISKKDINKSCTLKVLNEATNNKGKMVTKYSKIKLTPVVINKVNKIKTVNVGQNINFTNSNIGNSLLQIKSYTHTNSYTYSYEYCYNAGNCTTKNGIVSAKSTAGSTGSSLIVLDYELDLDKNTSYAKHILNDSEFFEDFITVSTYNGNEETEVLTTNVTPKDLQNKLILQVDGNIDYSKETYLNIVIRNKKYSVKLV